MNGEERNGEGGERGRRGRRNERGDGVRGRNEGARECGGGNERHIITH